MKDLEHEEKETQRKRGKKKRKERRRDDPFSWLVIRPAWAKMIYAITINNDINDTKADKDDDDQDQEKDDQDHDDKEERTWSPFRECVPSKWVVEHFKNSLPPDWHGPLWQQNNNNNDSSIIVVVFVVNVWCQKAAKPAQRQEKQISLGVVSVNQRLNRVEI